MIEINSPSEDKTPKQKSPAGKVQVPVALLISIVPWVVGGVICLNVLLIGIAAFKAYQLNKLQGVWTQKQPQRQELEGNKKESAILSEEQTTINKILAARVNWAQKLNILSSDIPNGMWFTELSLNPKALIVRGSVISLQKDEMGQVNKFIDSLKRNTTFFNDCMGIELGPIQRKTVAGFDLVDFLITCSLKAK